MRQHTQFNLRIICIHKYITIRWNKYLSDQASQFHTNRNILKIRLCTADPASCRNRLIETTTIKVSRSIKEQNQRLRAAREALCTALGREPTLEELAAQIGVSCEEAAASMAADSPVESLSAPASAGEETGLLLQDRIAGETAENEVLLDRMLLGDLLKMLNGRQREIIVRHYFYDQTQTQIAAQLGISQVQVSRIERKILGQMRAKLEET